MIYFCLRFFGVFVRHRCHGVESTAAYRGVGGFAGTAANVKQEVHVQFADQEEEVHLEAHPRESGCSLGNALVVGDFAHVVDPLHVLGGGVAPDVGQPLSGVAEVVLVQVVLVEALLVAVRERVDEELVVGQLL